MAKKKKEYVVEWESIYYPGEDERHIKGQTQVFDNQKDAGFFKQLLDNKGRKTRLFER